MYVSVIDPAVKDADYTSSHIMAERSRPKAQAIYKQVRSTSAPIASANKS